MKTPYWVGYEDYFENVYYNPWRAGRYSTQIKADEYDRGWNDAKKEEGTARI